MTRKNGERKWTAYHEAGHATIGRVLTLACGGATIKPDFDNLSRGCAITKEPYACLSEWERRGKVRFSDTAVFHARIITYMAGVEAEIELLGRHNGGDSDDRHQINLMAFELLGRVNDDGIEELPPEWTGREARLRAMTRMLVRRHKARIKRVAEALLAKTTLSCEELNELVGRSVADVKVNAPFLLAMHRLRQGSAGPDKDYSDED